MKDAAPKTKPSKRDAILNAMLDVVVEGGFHDAPMSVISKRSGASTGVIYHHFASKQEIIDALYTRVTDLKRASLLDGYTPAMEARQAFIHVWTNTYHFYRKHQREMRFLVHCENAGFVCQHAEDAPDIGIAMEFERRFGSRAQGGVLNDWPREVMHEMTIGLAERLAQRPELLGPELLRELALSVWEAVRAP